LYETVLLETYYSYYILKYSFSLETLTFGCNAVSFTISYIRKLYVQVNILPALEASSLKPVLSYLGPVVLRNPLWIIFWIMILMAYSPTPSMWQGNWWVMNSITFGRNWLSPEWGSDLAFAWIACENPRKPQNSRCTCWDSNRAPPDWES
jgi:hypothetical protein